MTSLIDTNSVQIKKLAVPKVVGIEAGSPSVVSQDGDLGVDATTLGLYVGSGGGWISAATSSGLASVAGTAVSAITLTSSPGGQPSFSNCVLYVQKVAGTVTMVHLTLKIMATIASTGAAQWVSGVVIPAGYRPMDPIYFTCTQYSSILTAPGYVASNFYVNQTGVIGVYSTQAAATIGYFELQCTYPV